MNDSPDKFLAVSGPMARGSVTLAKSSAQNRSTRPRQANTLTHDSVEEEKSAPQIVSPEVHRL